MVVLSDADVALNVRKGILVEMQNAAIHCIRGTQPPAWYNTELQCPIWQLLYWHTEHTEYHGLYTTDEV